jgi:hypothetical protein
VQESHIVNFAHRHKMYTCTCVFCLQFLTPIIFRSPSIESSHPIAGLPAHRVPSGLWRVNFLQGFCSCILKRCHSHHSLLDNHFHYILFII